MHRFVKNRSSSLVDPKLTLNEVMPFETSIKSHLGIVMDSIRQSLVSVEARVRNSLVKLIVFGLTDGELQSDRVWMYYGSTTIPNICHISVVSFMGLEQT